MAMTGCSLAPGRPTADGARSAPPVPAGVAAPAGAESGKTLVLITRSEPETLAGTALTALTGSTGGKRRLFNAALTLLDGDDRPLPYLAEALPQFGTESWRVFPDGRMATRYHLRGDLVWHDGAPLTADDFVFAWMVYATPELGRASSEPIPLMEEVTAPDPRTVVIHWRQPYPEAGVLEGVRASGNTGPSFAPLPRHLLEAAYTSERSTFAALPFWTLEYVGAGPYQLEQWVPGTYVDGVAFARHALGRPQIDRVRLTFTADANAVLANLLAGVGHLPVDDALRIQGGLVLKREWEARGLGRVEFVPRNWRVLEFQHRPEYAHPAAILDARVRKALAHAIDKQAINDGLFEGVGIPADTMIHPTVDYFPALDRAVTKYPFDLRRTEALMTDAGYPKAPDGFHASQAMSQAAGRLVFEVTGTESPQNEAERTILADGWRRAGLETSEATFSAQELRDGFRLSTFRSIYATGSAAGIASMMRFRSDNIAGPENRWSRSNRGGWADAEYDRLVDSVQATLAPAERSQRIVDALRILTDRAGVISLYFNPTVLPFPANITNLRVRAAEAEPTWNIHLWELR
jgi:peptide/nickel transport system substrate-binding protein